MKLLHKRSFDFHLLNGSSLWNSKSNVKIVFNFYKWPVFLQVCFILNRVVVWCGTCSACAVAGGALMGQSLPILWVFVVLLSKYLRKEQLPVDNIPSNTAAPTNLLAGKERSVKFGGQCFTLWNLCWKWGYFSFVNIACVSGETLIPARSQGINLQRSSVLVDLFLVWCYCSFICI